MTQKLAEEKEEEREIKKKEKRPKSEVSTVLQSNFYNSYFFNRVNCRRGIFSMHVQQFKNRNFHRKIQPSSNNTYSAALRSPFTPLVWKHVVALYILHLHSKRETEDGTHSYNTNHSVVKDSFCSFWKISPEVFRRQNSTIGQRSREDEL